MQFGLAVRHVHVDTTLFSVTREYDPDLDAHTIAVTYGYSHNHLIVLLQVRKRNTVSVND